MPHPSVSGGIGLLCMLFPVQIMEGVIVDYRIVIVSLAGLFGGAAICSDCLVVPGPLQGLSRRSGSFGRDWSCFTELQSARAFPVEMD